MTSVHMNKWTHPNPIFLDFETQSAADIDELGGRLYALHPSTRILMLSVVDGSTYHLWIPDYIRMDTSRWVDKQLWPAELKPFQKVRLHRGSSVPDEISSACSQRPCVAHNAFGFDKHIWERFCPGRPEWMDSLYLARLSGRTGGLDALSKAILGIGKDRAKKLLPILTQSRYDMFGCVSHPLIKPGDLQAFARYAVADVELLRRLWHGELSTVEVETDVIETHNRMNERGVMVDVPLLYIVENVSRYSTNQAAITIAKITDGKIPPDKLRSTKVIHEWLDSYGVVITDESKLDSNGKPKASLRKDIVQKYIDSPYLVDEHLRAVREIPPVVIDVLKLRMKALRITDAKVKKAQQRVSKDGRIRDLLTYAIAITRRFGSTGVQIHNLPNANEWLNDNLERILKTLDTKCNDVKKVYESIQEMLPPVEAGKPLVTVDDVCSALIRPCIIAPKGKVFLIADYSQIESRCVGWMAGEKKLLDVFANNGDPYRDFAAKVYKVPLDKVTKDMRKVGKIGILGLGYGMGAFKFRVFAANSGIDLVKAQVTADEVVDTYRDTYTRIAGWKPTRGEGIQSNFRVGGLWKEMDRAVMDTVSTGQPHHVGKCLYQMNGSLLTCTLPSEGKLYYQNARIEDVIPPYVWTMNLPPNPKATVVYDSNRGVKSLFGGLETENGSQAISRDIMALATVRLDERGFNPIMTVHDEIVCEVEEQGAEKKLREMLEIMVDVPRWAEGFPIAAEGYISPRFVKKSWDGYLKLETKHF